MTIKNLGDIAAFTLLPGGDTLVLEGTKRRRIRIEFNADSPASLYAIKRDGKDISSSQFVADIEGFTIVDFVAEGVVELQVAAENGAQVWYYTSDGTGKPVLDGETTKSFAKLHTPRARNHAEEMMRFHMEQNMRAFQEQMLAEMDRRFKADPTTNPVTGEVIEAENDEPEATDTGATGEVGSEPDASEGAADPATGATAPKS